MHFSIYYTAKGLKEECIRKESEVVSTGIGSNAWIRRREEKTNRSRASGYKYACISACHVAARRRDNVPARLHVFILKYACVTSKFLVVVKPNEFMRHIVGRNRVARDETFYVSNYARRYGSS